jgi:hypothetical protein
MAMTAFSPDASTAQPLDWAILRDGGVALYWRSEILDDDLNWFERSGYRIISLDADWDSEVQMHECLQGKLSFPSYYGRNLDALDECICDDLPVPETGGLVLALKGYDRFARALQWADPGRGKWPR